MRAVFLLVMVGLAGCAADSGPETLDDAPDALRVEGVVVDAAIVPIANASIEILGSNATLHTDGNGQYAFAAVAGTYALRISKEGFLAAEVTVVVPANATAPVQIKTQLERVAIQEPFSNVLKWDGVIQCAARYSLNALAACGLVYETADGAGLGGPLEPVRDDAEENYPEIDTPPSLVQSEMVWDSTQALGSGLRLMYTDPHRGGADNYAIDAGPSPLMVRADNGTLMFKHLEDEGLLIRVFPGEAEGTGFGVTLAQDFSVFTSLYYNYAPPDDWRFTDSNALHPPP